MIAVIPARRGSKSIPGKNRLPIAGRPLVQWTIEAALAATAIDRVVVATDDPDVATIATRLGATVHARSEASATDDAPTEVVLREVAETTGGDEFVLLQATSPLTRAEDIDGAVALLRTGGYDSVASVVPQHRFLWRRDGETAAAVNYDPAHRPRRQEATPLLVENGAIYVYRAAVLTDHGSRLGGRIGLYEMPEATYFEVDEPEDWVIVERLLARRRAQEAVSVDLREIRLVLTDVDGVLTDNGMIWHSDGTESKRFSARDGKGFELLHRQGIKTGLITSEAVELVRRRGAKLGCHHVELGCRDKVAAAETLRRDLGLEWAQIAFVGDDVHDLGLLGAAGLSACPADAVPAVRAAVDLVLGQPGGSGCFRELADFVLAGGAAA